jgi:hypothetical protein
MAFCHTVRATFEFCSVTATRDGYCGFRTLPVTAPALHVRGLCTTYLADSALIEIASPYLPVAWNWDAGVIIHDEVFWFSGGGGSVPWIYAGSCRRSLSRTISRHL